MSIILFDESGDLGFDWSKKKTSKYFLISFLICEEAKPLHNIVKKIFQGFSKAEIKSHAGILHAYKERPTTRLKLLNMLCKEDVKILSIYLNKKRVYTRLQDEQHVLYNYVTNILLDRIFSKKLITSKTKLKLIASKRETNKLLNANFTKYLEAQSTNNHKVNIDIEIKSTKEEKALQIVDFVSWSLFRNKEHNDGSYREIIKSHIIEENGLFA